jgi:signal transduction histidine kinase
MEPRAMSRDAENPGADPALTPQAPARVLVVDDEASVVDVFQEFLTTQGYEIAVASSGEEALRRIPDLKPDIILTDLNLPGVSGLEVMRLAKKADPEACVVVVTGYASASTAIDALRQGAYDYVTKPFDLDDVLQIVERGIANRRLRMENRKLLEELREKNAMLSQHEHELRERVRVATSQMTQLYEIGKEVSADLELSPRLTVIVTRVAEITGARAAVVYLRRDESQEYHAVGLNGLEPLSPDGLSSFAEPGKGVIGRSVESQTTLRWQTHQDGERFDLPGVVPTAVESALVVPLVAEGQVLGVLAVLDKAGGFTDDDENFLTLFASQAAIGIRNSQLYEHTKSLDRLKSEFVAVVSHEIRTPLTSVKGAVELLADEHYFKNSDQQTKLLTIAHANAERLLVLINDILDFSKLDSASLPMHIERQRLEPVVVQATQNLRTQMEEHDLQLVTELSNELPDVMLDPARIAQVLTNLLSNAIKFSPPRGRIDVIAVPWDGVVRVTVRDQGEGIAPQDLPKLFRKFSQVDSSATRKAGGTGLGLVISKGIIEQHGGQMSVDSTPGQGSSFHFTLPTAPVAVPAGRE